MHKGVLTQTVKANIKCPKICLIVAFHGCTHLPFDCIMFQGAEIVQTANSDPGIAVSKYSRSKIYKLITVCGMVFF